MTINWRAATAALAAAALAACGTTRDSAPSAAAPIGVFKVQPPAKLAPGAWPQSVSDLPADPEIRFGVLPNGMRYAIRRQAVPAGQAALRLRLDAGSLMEDDAEQGLAHFLEHMAFNGSKGVPEGDMVKILERLGLAFGADTNASTDFDETIYRLDLPKTNDETVDTALMLLRETAGSLTIAPAAVDRERGVVLSEERARDVPGYRVFKARMGFVLKGQRPPERYPIGQVEVLKTAPAERLAGFYHRYYRPERAVLVAVGDFDPAAMEARIRARFGDWAGEGPAGTEPNLGPPARRGPEAKIVVDPGVRTAVQLSWIGPPDNSPDTVAKRRRDLIEALGLAVLNRRYSSLARAGDPPFISAAAFKGDEYDAAEVASVVVSAQTGGWSRALSAAEQEQRRAIRFGVRQDELDREVAETRAVLAAAAAGAATRRPSAIAAEITGSLSDDQVVTSPADDLALFEAAVKDLKAETVSAALKAAFTGDGPLVFVAAPEAPEGGEAGVLAALAASQAVAVQASSAPSAASWPYQSFGAPGQVAEQREVADLDTAFVRFANGVRLTVKPTKFRDDQVLVRVNVGEGMAALPADKQSMAWSASSLIEGGLKQISAEDMERVLADRVYGARFTVGEDGLALTGATRTDHLATQMQVLAAYLAEPAWRPEAFARIKTAAATINEQYEASDSGVLARDLPGLLHAGDRRWTFPSREALAQATQADLKGQIEQDWTKGAVEVVIVGDITVDKAIQATAETFGALPPRPAEPAAKRVTGFPGPTAQPVVLTHKGRGDQSIAYVAWPSPDFFSDPQGARNRAVMGEVLGLRLIDELREAQGATYSPSVSYTHSLSWPGWGYMAASVEVPPERLAPFFADVAKIAADLKTNLVGADELARAKQPRIERFERARVTNEYWLGELSGAQADPRRLDAIRAAVPGTQRVTAEDVRRAAQAVLRDETAWRLEVRPRTAQ